MGVVPALIVKFLFKQRLSEYGVQLGDRARTVRTFLLLAPVFVAIAYGSSRDPSIAAVYPINPHAGASPTMFAWHVATYALFYLGWEFHFRGFLQFGLTGKLGVVQAVLIQVMASSLLHIGKPAAETFGAIAGGILWGVIAYRTRSLLSGLLQHFLLGTALDWFLCYRGSFINWQGGTKSHHKPQLWWDFVPPYGQNPGYAAWPVILGAARLQAQAGQDPDIGHQLVKADWNRFRPTKPVKKSQYGWCSTANDTLAMTATPAASRNPRSMVMVGPPFRRQAACPWLSRSVHKRCGGYRRRNCRSSRC